MTQHLDPLCPSWVTKNRQKWLKWLRQRRGRGLHPPHADSLADLETTKDQIESVSQTFVPSIINASLLPHSLWSFQSIFYHLPFFLAANIKCFFLICFISFSSLCCLPHLCVHPLFFPPFGLIVLICLISLSPSHPSASQPFLPHIYLHLLASFFAFFFLLYPPSLPISSSARAGFSSGLTAY